MSKRSSLPLLVFAVLLGGLSLPAMAADLASPNGAVTIDLGTDAHGHPTYAVSFHGRTVIAPSMLGLKLKSGGEIGTGMKRTTTSRSSADTGYTLVAGKTSRARDHYNEMVVTLAGTGGAPRTLDLVFRAYDDGAAFRYRLPVQPGLAGVDIANELTQFVFAADYDCHGLNLGKFGTSHEGEYDPVKASRFRPHNLFELPVTCRTGVGDTSFAIAEADLHDYAGLYLTGRETGELGLAAKLSPRLDDPLTAVRADVSTADLLTPWRVIMLGDTPGALIESTLITNLNPAPAGDFSWVKPGKTAWDWWNGPTLAALPKAGMNNATIKAYIDFASASGLPYMLIDDGWYVHTAGGGTVSDSDDIMRTVPAIDLPALVKYAADRKVGLWLWAHWKVLDRSMDQALPYYAKLGIKGIKIDFMDRDDQDMVAFYQRIFKATAANHLMLDLHGAYHPTGAIRTWPQFLTQEGVMGAEYNKWTRRVTATHNVTLPFTRGLAGPYDYTPGGFRNATPETFRIQPSRPMVQTTRGQALAMYVVFDSPFEGVSDSPDNYRDATGFDFIEAVPTTWDETRVVSGAIGEQIVVARRRGRDWYVGAMTNEQGRDVAVPLAFLGKGKFTATRWQDGATPTEVTTDRRSVTAADTIDLKLAPSGGGTIRLAPAR